MTEQVISEQARLAATAIKALGKDATEVGIGLAIDAAMDANKPQLLRALIESVEEAADLQVQLDTLRAELGSRKDE